MRDLLVVGWMVAFAAAVAFALVRRRPLAWASLALLSLPPAYVIYAVRYGTG